ncbi:MAG TPA: hypothetical protein VK891_17940, partial [Euzebyales bacterium]|nr:hypothetical protein [Euzebyales bacterium]
MELVRELRVPDGLPAILPVPRRLQADLRCLAELHLPQDRQRLHLLTILMTADLPPRRARRVLTDPAVPTLGALGAAAAGAAGALDALVWAGLAGAAGY